MTSLPDICGRRCPSGTGLWTPTQPRWRRDTLLPRPAFAGRFRTPLHGCVPRVAGAGTWRARPGRAHWSRNVRVGRPGRQAPLGADNREQGGRETHMAVVTMKELLESGVHFGHQTKRWNPKMKPFIFTERNGIYIIDLQQTLNYIDRAFEFLGKLLPTAAMSCSSARRSRRRKQSEGAGDPGGDAVCEPALARWHAD